MKKGDASTATLAPACLFRVNIPPQDVAKVIEAITNVDPLTYGNYDQVIFRSSTGTHQYRSLERSRAGKSELVIVPADEISFVVPDQDEVIWSIVEAIMASHPYEEPVILMQKVMRSQRISGRN